MLHNCEEKKFHSLEENFYFCEEIFFFIVTKKFFLKKPSCIHRIFFYLREKVFHRSVPERTAHFVKKE